MGFWKNVERELEYIGKTRKELAAVVGFDVTNISFGIKRNSIPSADMALKISKFLGVSLEFLLDFDGNSEPRTSDNIQINEIENCLRRFSREDINAVHVITKALNEKYKKN